MRKRIKKIDKHDFILLGIGLLFLIATMKKGMLFGSTIDWQNQHTTFPDYFRTLFYSTGNLFPNLAMHIGAGQNIYNFSYYGLYNPLILLSYLFPFIKMVDYIQIINILIYLSTGLLFYRFLKKESKENIAFLGSIFFLLSSPILFQIHKHYMFISYMPFLLVSLICIQNYFEKKSLACFTIFNTLLIFTSYYYSIACFITEGLYYIYLYLKKNSFSLKKFLKDTLPLLLSVFLSLGLSAILLLPTIMAIKNGRTPTLSNLSLSTILLPNLNLKNFFYDPYGLGVSFLSLAAIFSYACSKRENKEKVLLSRVLLFLTIIPLVMYFLNGKLYIRAKVFIPFIPLFILFLTFYLEKILITKKSSIKQVSTLFLLFLFYNLLVKQSILYDLLFLLDFLLTILFLKKKDRKFLTLYIAFLFLVNILFSYTEKFVPKESPKEISNSTVLEVLEKDPDIYRMKQLEGVLKQANKVFSSRYYTDSIYSSIENIDYKNFLLQELQIPFPNRNKLMLTPSPNIVSDSYLGVKYIMSSEDLAGYQSLGNHLYQNPYARKIVYTTSKNLSLEDYQKLKYPYHLEYLLATAITSEKTNTKITSQIEKVPIPRIISQKEMEVQENGVKIKTTKKLKIEIPSNEQEKKILMVKFRIKNKSNIDRKITINGTTNQISTSSKEYPYYNNNQVFHYILETGNNYHITISPGEYDITDIEAYTLPYSYLETTLEEIENIRFSKEETTGDQLVGEIEAKEDGYLVTSIPYDQGFSIYIDHQKQEVEKVNLAFIGTKIKKGHHHVKICYQAPLLKEGKIMSFFSLLLLGILLIYEKYVRCKRNDKQKFGD